MSAFLTGFGTGFAKSLSEQYEEERKAAAETRQLAQKLMYEERLDDMKHNKSKERELADFNESISYAFPDATVDDIAKAYGLTKAGADRNKVMMQLEKDIKARRSNMSGALPGMGGNNLQQDMTQEQSVMTGRTPAPPPLGRDPAGFGIDLTRPAIDNADGSFSTERTITVGMDDKFYNIPTIVNGKQVSEQEAISYAQQNLAQYPSFNSQEEAVSQAQARSNAIGQQRTSAKPWEIPTNDSMFAPEFDHAEAAAITKPFADAVEVWKKSDAPLEFINEAQEALTALTGANIPSEERAFRTNQTQQLLSQKAERMGLNPYGAEYRKTMADGLKSMATTALSSENPRAAAQLSGLAADVYRASPDQLAVIQSQANKIIASVRKPASITENTTRIKNQVEPLVNAANVLRQQGRFEEAAALDVQVAAAYRTGNIPDAASALEPLVGLKDPQATERLIRTAARVIDPDLPADGSFVLKMPGEKEGGRQDRQNEATAAVGMAGYLQEKGLLGTDDVVAVTYVADMLKKDFGLVYNDKPGQPTTGPDGTTTNQFVELPQNIIDRYSRFLNDPEFVRKQPETASFIREQLAKNYTNGQEYLRTIRKQSEATQKSSVAKPDMPEMPGVTTGDPLLDRKLGVPKETTPSYTEPPITTDTTYNTHLETIRRENTVKTDKVDPKIKQVSDQLASMNETQAREAARTLSVEDITALKEYEASKPREVVDTKQLTDLDPEFAKLTEDLKVTGSDLIMFARKNPSIDEIKSPGAANVREAIAERQARLILSLDEERFAQFLGAITDPTLQEFFSKTRQSWTKSK